MSKGPAVYLSVSGADVAAAVRQSRTPTFLTVLANEQSNPQPPALSKEELDRLAKQRAQVDNVGGWDPARRIVLSAHEYNK